MFTALSYGAKSIQKQASETTPLTGGDALGNQPGGAADDDTDDLAWDSSDEREYQEYLAEGNNAESQTCPRWMPSCCQATTITKAIIPLYVVILVLAVLLLLMQAIGITGEQQTELFYTILGASLFGSLLGCVGELYWAGLLESLNKESEEYKNSNMVLEERIGELRVHCESLREYNSKLREDRSKFRGQIDKFEQLKQEVSRILANETDAAQNTTEKEFMDQFLSLIRTIEAKECAQYLDMYYQVILAEKLKIQSRLAKKGKGHTRRKESQEYSESIEKVCNPFYMNREMFDKFLNRCPVKIAKRFSAIVAERGHFSISPSEYTTSPIILETTDIASVNALTKRKQSSKPPRFALTVRLESERMEVLNLNMFMNVARSVVEAEVIKNRIITS